LTLDAVAWGSSTSYQGAVSAEAPDSTGATASHSGGCVVAYVDGHAVWRLPYALQTVIAAPVLYGRIPTYRDLSDRPGVP